MLDYLAALRGQLDAVRSVADGLARYNTLLARVQQERGTWLEEFGVCLYRADNPGPGGSLAEPPAAAAATLPTLIVAPPPVDPPRVRRLERLPPVNREGTADERS